MASVSQRLAFCLVICYQGVFGVFTRIPLWASRSHPVRTFILTALDRHRKIISWWESGACKSQPFRGESTVERANRPNDGYAWLASLCTPTWLRQNECASGLSNGEFRENSILREQPLSAKYDKCGKCTQSPDTLAARLGACVPAPADRWLFLRSCRNGSPLGRRDLFTFCHLAWDAALSPFHAWLWLPWQESLLETEGGRWHFPLWTLRVLRFWGLITWLLAFHGDRGAAWPRAQVLGCGPEKEAGHASVAPLRAGTSAITNCSEDPLTGPDLKDSPPSGLLCTRHHPQDKWGCCCGNRLEFPLNSHSQT